MPAAAGATTIPVAPLSAPLPAGAVLNFSQAKAVLVVDAPTGAIFLEVQPLGAPLPSGAQVNWSGEILVRSQLFTRIALAQPLSSAIPEGASLTFPSGNVILAQEAAAGSTYLYAHPVEPPPVGAIATYTQELFQLPYSKRLVARGGVRLGGASAYYPYSLVNPEITQSGGILIGGISGRLNFAHGGILVGGTTGQPLLIEIIGGIRLGGTAVSYTPIVQSMGGVALGGTTSTSVTSPMRGGLLLSGGVAMLATTIKAQSGGFLIGGNARVLSSFAFGGVVLGGSAAKEILGNGPLEATMLGAADLESLMFN